jgi:hypothetical protein
VPEVIGEVRRLKMLRFLRKTVIKRVKGNEWKIERQGKVKILKGLYKSPAGSHSRINTTYKRPKTLH